MFPWYYSHDIPTISPWYLCHIAMNFPWFSHDVSISFARYSHGFPMIPPWFSHETPMIFPWYPDDIPMVFPWYSHDIPTERNQPRGWVFTSSCDSNFGSRTSGLRGYLCVFLWGFMCNLLFYSVSLGYRPYWLPLHFHINFTFQPSTLCQAIFLEALGDAQLLLRWSRHLGVGRLGSCTQVVGADHVAGNQIAGRGFANLFGKQLILEKLSRTLHRRISRISRRKILANLLWHFSPRRKLWGDGLIQDRTQQLVAGHLQAVLSLQLEVCSPLPFSQADTHLIPHPEVFRGLLDYTHYFHWPWQAYAEYQPFLWTRERSGITTGLRWFRVKKTKDTTALKILGATAAADGRFPAATANAAATLDPALLAFGLDFAAGSCTHKWTWIPPTGAT